MAHGYSHHVSHHHTSHHVRHAHHPAHHVKHRIHHKVTSRKRNITRHWHGPPVRYVTFTHVHGYGGIMVGKEGV